MQYQRIRMKSKFYKLGSFNVCSAVFENKIIYVQLIFLRNRALVFKDIHCTINISYLANN